MIVKNEEENLPACLGSVADLVDEIIVVDTGSTDRTREVAAGFGARVYEFRWCDSFAAARNESVRHARADWIFWMDADDRLDEDNRKKLRALFTQLKDENAAYVMKCLCLPNAATNTTTVVDHVRLFRNHPEVRWQYRVHEQILLALRAQQTEVRWTEVTIHHAGYRDPGVRARKTERDLRLLHLENTERPDDPFILFNLGWTYRELGRAAEALPFLRRSLALSHPTDSIVRKLYALLAQCHRQQGQPEEALAACREGRCHYPDDLELLFEEGRLLLERGDFRGAEQCLANLLAPRSRDHFASVDPGLGGYRARHLLAVAYDRQNRLTEAESQWRAALAERPDFRPALLGMGELWLAQARWSELDELARQLGAGTGREMAATLLRSRRDG